MAKTVKRHKKPNKRSLAAKARWAKIKAANENKTIKTPRKGYHSPSDIVARMTEQDEPQMTFADYSEKVLKPMIENNRKDQQTLRIKMPSPQTRLDNIFDKFEQAINETIAKLKATF